MKKDKLGIVLTPDDQYNLLTNCLSGLSLTDDQGRIIFWNKQIETITQLPVKIAAGRPLWDILFKLAPPEKKTEENLFLFRNFVKNICKTGIISELDNDLIEKKIVLPDGSLRTIEMRMVALNRIKGFSICTFIRDITQRCEFQRQIIAKTTALQEIVAQLDFEKKKILENINNNIRKIIMPILLKLKVSNNIRPYVDLLEKKLLELDSAYGSRITSNKMSRLTAKELEICTLIKAGMKNKEIASIQGTATGTVEAERRSIRKKLGLTNQKHNLQSFLNMLDK
jgi:DNA-binding CsgD family transcriptional regulator